MPQLGESVAEGTIGKWLKQPGDTVEKYEPLLEVITDKVNAEVPSPFAGILREILVEEGATVPNNAEIAVIETEEEAAGQAGAAPTATSGKAPRADPDTAGPAPEGRTPAAATTAGARRPAVRLRPGRPSRRLRPPPHRQPRLALPRPLQPPRHHRSRPPRRPPLLRPAGSPASRSRSRKVLTKSSSR